MSQYDASPEAGLSLLTVSENATFVVDDPRSGGRSTLRLHRPGNHSRCAIESELAWQAALRADHVVATPAVIPARDGSHVVVGRAPDGEPRYAVRFSWVSGSAPLGTPEDFRALGSITARLHRHARGWRLPGTFTRPRWDLRGVLGPDGLWGRWQDAPGVGRQERALLSRLEDELRRRLTAYGTGAERFGLVHADLRLANLLVSSGAGPQPSEPHVIDFDDCGFGWFLYDLGAALSFIEHEPRVPELVDAWLGGYRAVAPLDPADEAESMTFVLLRRLLLVAWTGSHPDAEPAAALGADFTQASCDLAERFLG